MIFNVMLFVKSLSELVRPEVLAEVNNGNMQMPDLGDIARQQSKMIAMKEKFAGDHGANLGNLKRRATGEIARPDGLTTRDSHKKAMGHWFHVEKESPEQALSDRLEQASRSRQNNLPAIEPLPSSEDSFLAWTSEDEYFFDRPVREMWKTFDDESTDLIKADVRYVNEGPAKFDAQPESNQSENSEVDEDYLSKIDVGSAFHSQSSISLSNYWVE